MALQLLLSFAKNAFLPPEEQQQQQHESLLLGAAAADPFVSSSSKEEVWQRLAEAALFLVVLRIFWVDVLQVPATSYHQQQQQHRPQPPPPLWPDAAYGLLSSFLLCRCWR